MILFSFISEVFNDILDVGFKTIVLEKIMVHNVFKHFISFLVNSYLRSSFFCQEIHTIIHTESFSHTDRPSHKGPFDPGKRKQGTYLPV